MFLDSVENVHAVLAVHHVNGQPSLAEAAGAADPVQVGLVVWISILIHRQVKVDNNRDLLYIDPWQKESIGLHSFTYLGQEQPPQTLKWSFDTTSSWGTWK